jgi:hypothetical protein
MPAADVPLATWPSVGNNHCTRDGVNSLPPQIASLRSLLAVSSCANEYACQFWLQRPSLRATMTLSPAGATRRPPDPTGRQTMSPREQRPIPKNPITPNKPASSFGGAKAGFKSLPQNLASRVLNYALILATLTPLSSWLTVVEQVPVMASWGRMERSALV